MSSYYDYLYSDGLKNAEKWMFERDFEDDYTVVTQFIKERYDWMNSVFESKDKLVSSLQ